MMVISANGSSEFNVGLSLTIILAMGDKSSNCNNHKIYCKTNSMFGSSALQIAEQLVDIFPKYLLTE